MDNYICITCGTQYPAGTEPPAHCPICEDDRQYINVAGQQWTSMTDLSRDHSNVFVSTEPGLTGIHSEPSFAISRCSPFIRRSLEDLGCVPSRWPRSGWWRSAW